MTEHKYADKIHAAMQEGVDDLRKLYCPRGTREEQLQDAVSLGFAPPDAGAPAAAQEFLYKLKLAYGSGFYYVPSRTFPRQTRGYWSYTISGGGRPGPGKEIYFYGSPTAEGYHLDCAEFWYSDSSSSLPYLEISTCGSDNTCAGLQGLDEVVETMWKEFSESELLVQAVKESGK